MRSRLQKEQQAQLPTTDDIVNIGTMYSRTLVELVVLSKTIGTQMSMSSDILLETIRTSEFVMMDGTFNVTNTSGTIWCELTVSPAMYSCKRNRNPGLYYRWDVPGGVHTCGVDVHGKQVHSGVYPHSHHSPRLHFFGNRACMDA